MRLYWCVVLAALMSSPSALADEGQWTPDQIAELDARRLGEMGLSLAPRELYNEQDGGLMRAIINYGGCTASFVSPEGLIVTNHHCAYSDLQSQSTPEADHLQDGFVAADRSQELPAKNRGGVQVLLRVRDVSADVHRALEGVRDHRARAEAADRAKKELVKRCEEQAPDHKCLVASFYGGLSYRLFESLELRDIRIVYAPPAAVGEYGGDIDNWMWPRHTGDFALLRAYVGPDGKPADYSADNVPYRPARWLTPSADGVTRGDFVMIMGYPGNTERYLPSGEIARQVDQVLPGIVGLYGEWIALLEAQAKRGKDVALKVAPIKKGLANREKNARGMLDGIARMNLLEERRARDARLAAYAATPEGAQYGKVLGAIDDLVARRRQRHGLAFMMSSLRYATSLTPLAIDLVRRAREQAKPDLERRSPYMDRNAPVLLKSQQRRLRNFDPEVEARLLASAIEAARKQGIAVEAFDALYAETEVAGQPLLDVVRARVTASKLGDEATMKQLFDAASLEALDALDDPMIALAKALATTQEAVEAHQDELDGIALLVDPAWFGLLRALESGPLYPDANGTLRFSYATVRGYAPRDGLWARAQTTLGGALRKHTGADPFSLPERVRAAAEGARDSYWADPRLGDLPLCFLSNGDTTGGNSGSPVVNGRGELVGLNFDRVWENIAGDYGYNPAHSRNIMVDARYLWWMLDRVDGAHHLLAELGLSRYRDAPPRFAGDTPRPPARNPVGCALAPPSPPGPWDVAWMLSLAAAALVRRRRQPIG